MTRKMFTLSVPVSRQVGLLAISALVTLGAAACGSTAGRAASDTSPSSASGSSPSVGVGGTTQAGGTAVATTPAPTTTTTVPCNLSATPGTANTVPINEVCSSSGTPHFDTPQAAMTYLADAWNSNNVQELDYVTNPAGRAEMDSMATLMVNLQFKSCTENPAGDYTCYFMHDIAASTSPTTYPNPEGFPPGEAVFTVAPAGTPGWYLTNVIHCG